MPSFAFETKAVARCSFYKKYFLKKQAQKCTNNFFLKVIISKIPCIYIQFKPPCTSIKTYRQLQF